MSAKTTPQWVEKLVQDAVAAFEERRCREGVDSEGSRPCTPSQQTDIGMPSDCEHSTD